MKPLKGLWGITVRLEDALHMIMVQRPLMEIRIRQSLSGPTAPSSKEKRGMWNHLDGGIGHGEERVKGVRGNGRAGVTGRGEQLGTEGGFAARRAARPDKEEIIQSINPSRGAIIRSHLFSRAILLFIELLCLERGAC